MPPVPKARVLEAQAVVDPPRAKVVDPPRAKPDRPKPRREEPEVEAPPPRRGRGGVLVLLLLGMAVGLGGVVLGYRFILPGGLRRPQGGSGGGWLPFVKSHGPGAEKTGDAVK